MIGLVEISKNILPILLVLSSSSQYKMRAFFAIYFESTSNPLDFTHFYSFEALFTENASNLHFAEIFCRKKCAEGLFQKQNCYCYLPLCNLYTTYCD